MTLNILINMIKRFPQPCRVRLFNHVNTSIVLVLCFANIYPVGSTDGDADPNACSTLCSYQQDYSNADCTGLDLTQIPQIAGLCRQAKTLDLKNNRILEVHSNDLIEYASLQYLYIGHNSINEISSNMCGNATGLKQLQLDNNNIRTISANAFQYLHSLEVLPLDVNAIADLEPGAFNGLSSLQILQLNDNDLSVLPPGIFMNLDSLGTLNIDSNDLGKISEEAFTGLRQLERLSLKKNSISTIELATFKSLTNLKIILLDNNNLTSIDAFLFRGLALEKVSLVNNNITTIRNLHEWLEKATTLSTLALSGNPLHCDCKMEPLRVWLKENASEDELSTCASPAEFRGMRLMDIDRNLCHSVIGLTSPLSTSQSRQALGVGGSSKNNGGTWKIVIVACVVFLALVAFVGGFLLIKKRRDHQQQEAEDPIQYSIVQTSPHDNHRHYTHSDRRRITSETQLMSDDSGAYESYTIPPDARGLNPGLHRNGFGNRPAHPHAPLVKQASTGSVTTSPDITIATPDANSPIKPKFSISEPGIPELELEFDDDGTCTSFGQPVNSSDRNPRRNSPPQYAPPPPPSQQHVFSPSPVGTNTGYLPLPMQSVIT
ncbi:uncharacterized protein [Amphiura filiformis]|uniref:uncharacterized protein n=1 Tax=Amphiura filiformis TaxID=82378 RepID=UPI003B2190C2